MVSKLNDILQRGYFYSLLGYDNVNWFENEVIKLGKKELFSAILKKDIILSEEDDDHYRSTKNWWFCEKDIDFNKVRDHCHLTGKYRGPAHEKCKTSNKTKIK